MNTPDIDIELWVKSRCVHGLMYHMDSSIPCAGGSEERLDPERVLSVFDLEYEGQQTDLTVQDVLDALGGDIGALEVGSGPTSGPRRGQVPTSPPSPGRQPGRAGASASKAEIGPKPKRRKGKLHT